MRLEITFVEGEIDKKFIEFIAECVSEKIISNIDDKKLIKFDEYISEYIPRVRDVEVTSREIITCGAENLSIYTLQDKFLIEISRTKSFDKVKDMTLVSLCKLINYGNSQIHGYPIFTDTFSEIAEDIDMYKKLYIFNRGG